MIRLATLVVNGLPWLVGAALTLLSGCGYLSDAYRPEPLSNGKSQPSLPGELIRFRPLSVGDFAAKPGKNVSERDAELFGAYVAVSINLSPYALIGFQPQGDEYRLLVRNLDYYAALDKTHSYWNTSEEQNVEDQHYTLEHENLHFAIHELAARRANRRIDELLERGYLGKDPVAILQRFIDDLKTVLEQSQRQAQRRDTELDIQTSVAFRPKTQANWRIRLERELAALDEYSFQRRMERRFPGFSNTSLYALRFRQVGLFEKAVCTWVLQPVSLSGYGCLADGESRFLEMTHRIPARKGIAFGVTFEPLQMQAGSWAELQVVIHYPEPGVSPPNANQAVARHTSHVLIDEQPAHVYHYVLREDWEVVPGEWRFEFYSQGKKVAEQRFELFEPSR